MRLRSIADVGFFQVITNGLTVSYMWELIINKPSTELTPIKTDFSLKYKLACKDDAAKEEKVTYHYYFDITNYEVLETPPSPDVIFMTFIFGRPFMCWKHT